MEIKEKTIEDQKVAIMNYKGSLSDMEVLVGKLSGWIEVEEIETAGNLFAIFYNNPRTVKENEVEYDCADYLCRTSPFWDPNAGCSNFCPETDLIAEYYTDKQNKTIRWDRIHGWKRRVLKTYIHNTVAVFKKQYEAWNRYVGRDDVLYIHARIGGGNWSYYWKQVVYQPWFIEKVDDGFDSTYCDIYAKIKVE